MYKWVVHFETTDFEIDKEWTVIPTGLFHPKKAKIIVKPTADNKTKIELHFQTEDISKPPTSQVAHARLLLDDFLNHLRFSLDHSIQATLIDVIPDSAKTEREYDTMKDVSWTFPRARMIVRAKVNTKNLGEFTKEFQEIYAGRGRARTAKERETWEVYRMMRGLLHFYAKSLEEAQSINQFVGIWVAFSILYNFVWSLHNSKDAKDQKKIEYFSVKSGVLSSDQCQRIVKDYRALALMELYYNEDFDKLMENNEWQKALNCVLQEVRDFRDSVFQGRWLPVRSYEGISFTMEDSVLEDCIGLLRKVLQESCKNLLQPTLRKQWSMRA